MPDPVPAISPTPPHLRAFRQELPAWFERVKRPMPWRATTDPYRIWLSEVMLQQTRVDQAEPYYERFVDAFPTVDALADAELDDVLLLWEGLGYYSRARNLHRAARMVVERFDGILPDAYDAIRELPGVGPYTAAAVLSIAYGRPHAVLDGNVARVLARVFTVGAEVTSSRTRRRLQELADLLLDPEDPGRFNEALMELGATICTPTSPECPGCPLRSVCAAHAEGAPERYPVSKARKAVPHHDVAVGLVFNPAGEVLIQRRPDEGLLGGLWEFPGGKREEGETTAEACRRELAEELDIDVEVGELFERIDHAYSHFKITLHAFRCRLVAGTPRSPRALPLAWVPVERLDGYAFPRANRRIIEALTRRRERPTLFDETGPDCGPA